MRDEDVRLKPALGGMGGERVRQIARGRTPHSLEAEMSILGGILLDNEAINRSLEILNPDEFYRESHRKIFRGMIDLSNNSEPCDLITLSTVLKKKGERQRIVINATSSLSLSVCKLLCLAMISQ